jgi:dTDP-4-amino-4,6-dideoxygalactose transaminase
LGEDLVCPRSGRRYRETVHGTLEEVGGSPGGGGQAGRMDLLDLRAQRRSLAGEIERAILNVVEHEKFIMGPEVAELEARLASFCGAGQAVTCASGTDALLLVLRAWAVGPGDAVFVPSFTFVATAEVVALLGATPYFVDVREDSFNLDPESLLAALGAVRGQSLRPKAVVAVDLFGQPADYDVIEAIAEEHGLLVLADAAQSYGASLGGRSVGTFGHVTATSFFPSKPLGCYGDGGAILTDDRELAAVLASLRVHGKGVDKYHAEHVGVNSRLDTLQAAVLLSKLAIFRDELEERERVAELYAKGLADVVAVPRIREDARSAWAQYTIRTEQRDALRAHLASAGIPTAIYYPTPLHQQKPYAGYPCAPSGLPVSESLARRVVSLPLHPYLEPSTQARIVDADREALAAADGQG